MVEIMDINDPSTSINASTVSSAVALDAITYSLYVIVINEGPDYANVKTGTASVEATSTDTRIPPYSINVYRKRIEHSHIAAISDGNSVIKIQYGSGV